MCFKDIGLQVNVIAWLEFKHGYYDTTVQYPNHYPTGTPWIQIFFTRPTKRVSIAQSPDLHGSRCKAAADTGMGSTKTPRAMLAFPWKEGLRCQAINIGPPRRVSVWGDGPWSSRIGSVSSAWSDSWAYPDIESSSIDGPWPTHCNWSKTMSPKWPVRKCPGPYIGARAWHEELIGQIRTLKLPLLSSRC